MKDTRRNKTNSIPVFLLWTALLTAFDQLTKYLAQTYLKGKYAVPVLKGVLDLLYLENKGAAFGILKNRRWLLVILALAITAGAAVLWHRSPKEKKYVPLRMVCALLSAGALGNMVDRIVRNYVIDFIYFSLIDFPVFNVADIYVCVSCGALMILLLFIYKEEDLAFLRRKKKA